MIVVGHVYGSPQGIERIRSFATLDCEYRKGKGL